MASRKDNKGRVLQTGEYQRKDGRYSFSYSDAVGTRHVFYAMSLQELRVKEKNRLMAGWQGADMYGMQVTLNYMYDRHMTTKIGLKESTVASYMDTYDRYVRDEFGKQFVHNIRYSDVQAFYAYLLKFRGLSVKTIAHVQNQIYPALEMAVRDGLIAKNPAQHAYGNFKRASGEKETKRKALTVEEQRVFLDFIDGHRYWGRYHSIFQIMLGTGLRVGELTGLRWCDVDFENKLIKVDHGLVFVKPIKGKTKGRMKINGPKTYASIREVPIMDPVMEAFKEEFQYAEARGFPSDTVDGYTNFIFTMRDGQVYTCVRLDKALRDIVDDYNRHETKLAEIEDREPFYLPRFSNHILRHTFCTRLCERDVNIKVIQTVMGHSSIKITMDIYAEVSQQKQIDEINKMAKELDVF